MPSKLYTYVNNNPINLNDPMGKLGGPFGMLNMRGALSNPDYARISNFMNTVEGAIRGRSDLF